MTLVLAFGCALATGIMSSTAAVHAQQAAHTVPAAVAASSLQQLELREVSAELAGTTRHWPALVLGTGVAGVLTGASVGAGRAISCEASCSAPQWIGMMIVSGAALSVVGLIWWLRVDHDITQLELKKSMLEQELEASRRRSAFERRELALRRDTQLFTLRIAL